VREVICFVLSVKDQWGKILTGSLVLVLLGILGATGDLRVPSFVYWLIICATLFWASFGAWREEHRARQSAEGATPSEEDKQLMNESRKLSSSLLLLMHRFPDSPAVRSPFSIHWRPSIGDTNVEWDIQEMVAWHSECIGFLDKLKKGFGSEATSKLGLIALLSKNVFPDSPPSSTETLMYMGEIEAFLLNKVH
jgi:hypothetical protein